MRLASDDGEFPKILIKGNEHPAFPVGAGKNFVIARINIPGA